MKVDIESDSELTVNAIHKQDVNYLEVGDVIASCRQKLCQLYCTSVNFIRKSANSVAHELARYPCLVHCQIIFSSPPCTVKATMNDVFS